MSGDEIREQMTALARDLRAIVEEERQALVDVVARHDEQLREMERLVRMAVCRCVVGSTTWSRRDCPIHNQFTPLAEVLRDKARTPAERSEASTASNG